MWNFFNKNNLDHKIVSSNKRSSIYTLGNAMWSSHSYNSFANEGYKNNPIVYRCIQEIATACISIPFILYDKFGKEISQHPILELLNKPNNIQSKTSFIENIICYRLLSGNVYIEASGNSVKELYVLQPDRVKIIPGNQGIPLFYDYKVDSNIIHFPVDQINGKSSILHWKMFNPTDEWYGMSPIQAISKSVDIHNQGNQWNKALLDHSCRPCGALVATNELTDEQYHHLQEQLKLNHSGSNNVGRTFIFEGGISWTDMSISPKDMDFMKSMQNSAREIAFALGVPPMLIGLPGDNTYSNQKEARLALWEQTIIPMMKNFCDTIGNWLSYKISGRQSNFVLDLDLDQISILSDRRQKHWSNMIEGVKNNIISVNEARVALGYQPSKDKIE